MLARIANVQFSLEHESRKVTSTTFRLLRPRLRQCFLQGNETILLLCVHVSLNLIVSRHTRVITLVRIVLQQQLATEAKPRTKLTDYRDRSRQYTLGKSIIIINKVSPGGSEWQKPPGNKQSNSKITALVAQSGKNHQGI